MSLFKKLFGRDKPPVGLGFGPYRYNYTYVPPLAYADSIHLENLPHLDWVWKVGVEALKILVNGLIVDLEEGAEELLEKVVEKLEKGLEHELVGFLGKELHDLLGFMADGRDALEKNERFKDLDKTKGWFKDLVQALRTHKPAEEKRSLEQYRELFKILPIPALADHQFNDEVFAHLRVAGYNPLVIQQMKTLPPNLALDQEKFRQAPGFENDSLAVAMEEGRLYLADYRELDVLEPGQTPAPKNVYRPLAVFGVPAGEGMRPLAPIAIQVEQTPAPGNLFGPADGTDWEKAKTCVESSDSNYHEMISHLGRTHLLVEPFVVATYRKLSSHHPVRELLMPHFNGTIFINGLAVDTLVNEGGPVDQLLQGTIKSDLVLSANGLLSVPFNEAWLPVWLTNRGLDDREALPCYPYRDDGLLVWEAINEWVRGYVSVHYASDGEVLADEALQGWCTELLAVDGGRVKGFGEQGMIRTRDYLANALTMVIYTASAAHAAVNFPQSTVMSYTPAVPLAGYQPAPNTFSPDPYLWIDMLPDIAMAKEQLQVLYLLGSVYYTRLGDYSEDDFDNPSVQVLARRFRQRLDEIEAIIAERNMTRPVAYPFLLPSLIPQSINI